MDPRIDARTLTHLLEEDIHELYEQAPCGYLSTLPDGRIIKVNATFLEWTGHSRDILLSGKRFQELLTVAGRVFYDTHFGPLMLMQGFVKELAFEILQPDGQRMPVLLNSILKRDEAGNPMVIRTTLLDARGRRAYEEELRLAKRNAEAAEANVKRLNETLEEQVAQRTQERDRIWRMSQDMLVVAALHGAFISFNPSFTRILGWTEDDLRAVPFYDLAHPNDLRALDDAVGTLRAGEPVQRFEIRNRHKDGSYRWVSWTAMPEGELLYAVGRDITEEKKQAATLQQTEEALRQAQKLEAIGKLTGGVAHDFNNILQVIGGNLELLKIEYAGMARAESRLNTAIASVSRGADLASQLLAFARKQPLQPMPTNLGRVLRGMDDLLRRALGEEIEIETIVGGGLWTALVDRNQLENVILNLAINARDAMAGQGKLTLELGNAFLDEHYASTHAEVTAGQYVMLAISDTGSGMTPEVMERAFEPFFTTKPEGEGTGLGLSMAYGFVKQSGGHIKIYSEVGHGTTFRIYLPRVHQEETSAPDVRRAPVKGGSETILVVEDDMAVQATVVDVLSGLGYKVLKARDGESALSVLQSGIAVDLLFTDVVMPGPIKSTDLAREARVLLPDIEVLFTSGYTQNAIVHGGRLDPGVELLSKPYRREDLARRVYHLLANRRQRSVAQTARTAIAGTLPGASVARGMRILVVEDNLDANEMLCEALRHFGHAPQGTISAEQALQCMEAQEFDVLLTDVSLPGMSGTELVRQALAKHPSLKIVFSTGQGDVALGDLGTPRVALLPKPYTLNQVRELLAVLQAMPSDPGHG